MGVLYYVGKLDGSRQKFALNKVYRYADMRLWERLEDQPLTTLWDDAPQMAAQLQECDIFQSLPADKQADWREWYVTIAERLFRWAGDAPLRFMSECGEEEWDEGLTNDQAKALITGSAHDSDYEADGITYKPGSAW